MEPSNPLRILEALDRYLRDPFELIVYGRAALALGYPNPPVDCMVTMDVDAILPSQDLQAIEANDDFWQAQDQVNTLFANAGLYFTHLFEEKQVVLSPEWRSQVVALSGFPFECLQLKRPSTHDLILTKMMRVDPQDREDIKFLIQQSDFSWRVMKHCIQEAYCPDIPEITDAFIKNADWLRGLEKA